MTKWKTFDFSNIAIRCLRNITGKLHYCIVCMFNISCNIKTYREIDTEALVGVFAFIITWWSNNQKCSCNIKNGNQKYCCYKHYEKRWKHPETVSGQLGNGDWKKKWHAWTHLLSQELKATKVFWFSFFCNFFKSYFYKTYGKFSV